MSGGLNKAFRQSMGGEFLGVFNPLGYLRAHLFQTQPDDTTNKKPAGIHTFNLEWSKGKRLNLKIAQGKRSLSAHGIKAYWCPNSERAAHRVTLGADANYFFTPALTGCILEIAGNVIIHHDANLMPWPPPSTLNLPRGGGSGRRIWHYNDLVSSYVIGVRRHGNWLFYQQTLDKGDAVLPPPNLVTIV